MIVIYYGLFATGSELDARKKLPDEAAGADKDWLQVYKAEIIKSTC